MRKAAENLRCREGDVHKIARAGPDRLWLGILLTLVLTISIAGCAPSEFLKERPRKIGHERGVYEKPAWSPSGKRISLQYRHPDAYVITDREGKEWTPLAIDPQSVSPGRPAIWLDEERLLYIESYTTDFLHWKSNLIEYRLPTHSGQVLQTDMKDIGDMDWNAPTGLLAMLVNSGELEVTRLEDLIQDANAKPVARIHDQFIEDVAFSKSGGQVAYSTAVASLSAKQSYKLVVYDLESGESTTLLESENTYITTPTWSPDGQWIAVSTNTLQSEENPYHSSLLLVSADGRQQIPVDTGRLQPVSLEWSPVDNIIAFSSLGRPGSNSLYLLDLSPWLPLEHLD